MNNKLPQKLTVLYASNKLPWVIIGIGIVLRLIPYLSNRSLWLDESCLSLNIINRSFPELLQPLSYNQGAPIGFLLLEKIAVNLFKNTEYALRLFPLLFGIVSLFLFYYVAKQFIRPKAVPIALSLFAISGPLIYYSSEVKQYSADVAIALLLYFVTNNILSKKMTASRVAFFGLVGAAAIWFSHPAVFILIGVGASLTLFYLSRKEWSRIAGLSIAYSLWGLSLTTCYLIFLRDLSNNRVLSDYWLNGFMPFPPLSLNDFQWFFITFFKIFEHPTGLYLYGIAVLAFLIGIFQYSGEKEKIFILILPIFFALIASGFHVYPFHGRLLLFIVPSLLLFIAEGAAYITDKTMHSSSTIGITFICLLFFIKPFNHTVEEIKPVLNYIRAQKQPTDITYLYYSSQYAFKYYSEQYGFTENDYIVGISSRNNWMNYIEDLNKLRGKKRVWILFSHDRKSEKILFLHYLNSIGKRLDFCDSNGASAYLYDLYDYP